MASSYIFFDPGLRDRFVRALASRALPCSQRADAMEGHVVELASDPADAVLEELEAEYEALMQEQMLLAEDRADWGSHQVVSLRIEHLDGSPATVRLPATVARVLLERYSVDEARDLVTAIAHSLENPEDGPLCRKDLLNKPRG